MKEYAVGLRGLALLSLLAQGNTHDSGTYARAVDKGIKYLVSAQQENGLFGPSQMNGHDINYMYNHGIATLVLLEDYCLSRDKSLEAYIKPAVSFIIQAQNEEGSWGYTAQSRLSDTSVTGWQIPVLRLARAIKIAGAAESLQKASQWLTRITNEKGQVGYRRLNQYPNGYYALTAVGMFSQLFLGWEKDDKLIQAQKKVLLENPPALHPYGEEMANDFYYWYFGTLAMFLEGGSDWQTWNEHMKKSLLAGQEKSGPEAGSWPACDRWSGFGGRIYTTTMALLTLQVYYRYASAEG